MGNVSSVGSRVPDTGSKYSDANDKYSVLHCKFRLFPSDGMQVCADGFHGVNCTRSDTSIRKYAIELIEIGKENYDDEDGEILRRTAFHISCFWNYFRKFIGSHIEGITFESHIDCHFPDHPPTEIFPSHSDFAGAEFQKVRLHGYLRSEWDWGKTALIRFVLHYKDEKSFDEIRRLFFEKLGDDFAHPFYQRKVEDFFHETQKVLDFMDRERTSPFIPDDIDGDIYDKIRMQKRKNLQHQKIDPDEEIEKIRRLLKNCNGYAVQLKLIHFLKSDDPICITSQICHAKDFAADEVEDSDDAAAALAFDKENPFQCHLCDSPIQGHLITGHEVDFEYDRTLPFRGCFRQAFFHIGCFMRCLEQTQGKYPDTEFEVAQVDVALKGYPHKFMSFRTWQSHFQSEVVPSHDDYLKEKQKLLEALITLIIYYDETVNEDSYSNFFHDLLEPSLDKAGFFKFECDRETFVEIYNLARDLIEKVENDLPDDDSYEFSPDTISSIKRLIQRLKNSDILKFDGVDKQKEKIINCNETFRKLKIDHDLHTQVINQEKEARPEREYKVLSQDDLPPNLKSPMKEEFRKFLNERLTEDVSRTLHDW